jgi:hypothetical protein
MARIVGKQGEPGVRSFSSDGDGEQVKAWLGEEGCSRPFAVEMAANHTLSLIYFNWKYIEPKGGPAMVPWGPKIETGYSTEPQLFQKVGGEFDETRNVAADNPTILKAAKNLLEGIRKNKRHFMEFQ